MSLLLILLYPLAVFAAMVVVTGFGRRAAVRRAERLGDAAGGESSAVVGAAFGLLGLFLAFTFSNAYSRLGGRRELVVQEANTIGTAWLRLDLIPEAERRPIQREVLAYTEARLRCWRVLPDIDAAFAELARAGELQTRIWQMAVAAVGQKEPGRLVLPALNEMIDIMSTRTSLMQAHPPLTIFVALFLLALACAWLAGAEVGKSKHPQARSGWLFAFLISLTTCLILDIEYPSFGLVSLDGPHEAFEQLLVQMRGV